MTEEEIEEKNYEEIVVKLAISTDNLAKLNQLISKRIFSSRAEAFRRSLELLFEKYVDSLKEKHTSET